MHIGGNRNNVYYKYKNNALQNTLHACEGPLYKVPLEYMAILSLISNVDH